MKEYSLNLLIKTGLLPAWEIDTMKIAFGVEKVELYLWAQSALYRLSESKQQYLMVIAARVIHNGGLRGNISDAWRSLGYTFADIPDLYV